jgi:hypothetical protein
VVPVNNGSSFLVFKYPDRHSGGFARDLFIDYMRWNYSKGNITYMNPRIIGLDQFPENDAIFHDLFSEYSKELCNTYQKTKPFFEEYLKNKA